MPIEVTNAAKKLPLRAVQKLFSIPFRQQSLDLGDCDRLVLADLDATFAADTFISIDRHRFFILNFIDIHRTNIHALSATDTFFNVHFRLICHSNDLLIGLLGILLPSPAAPLSKTHPSASAKPFHGETPTRKCPQDIHLIITQIFLIPLFSSASSSIGAGRGFTSFLAAVIGSTGHAPRRLQRKRGSGKYPVHPG
jgi:hypothetical protein